MARERSLIARILLSPVALCYRLGVGVRNWMFDTGILPSRKFENTTVISIGNITMGGTGKTPFTEYIVNMLMGEYRTAILSRGYKRKTSGYVLATGQSSAREIGDEPFQMKRKFPGVTVAVDGNRRRGINKTRQEVTPRPDVFVLDDAFQHRYVSPDVSILLVDYNNLITDDRIFPMGWLREPLKSKDRANIVVVTKCPADIKPIDLRVTRKELHLYPYQELYFTQIDYHEPVPLFPGVARVMKPGGLAHEKVLTISAIASPAPFEQHTATLCGGQTCLRYADHHFFRKKDYKAWKKHMETEGRECLILTTEKDAMRMLQDEKFPAELKPLVYYIPLNVKFIADEDKFRTRLNEYIRKNQRYMQISKE